MLTSACIGMREASNLNRTKKTQTGRDWSAKSSSKDGLRNSLNVRTYLSTKKNARQERRNSRDGHTSDRKRGKGC